MIDVRALPLTGGVPVGRDEARRQAREELSRAIYHRYDDPWPVALAKAIGRALRHLVGNAAAHAPGGGVGLVVFVALIVGLIALAIWRTGPMRRDTRAMTDILVVAGMTARQHRDAARAAAERGDWQVASIEAMRAVARELEERHVLDPRPGRTADELAREAGDELPKARTALVEAATAFDAVAYGGRPGDRTSYEMVCRADNAVRGGSRVVGV